MIAMIVLRRELSYLLIIPISSTLSKPLFLHLEYTPYNCQADGVGGVHAHVGQAASAKVLALAERRIAGVVQDAQVERDAVQVDHLVDRVARRAEHLVHG